MPSGGTFGNKGGTGRPVTIPGKENIKVRLSPELNARVRAATEAAHVTLSESVRLFLEILADSPADTLAAMVEDPEAVRTLFVERVLPAVRRVPAG